MSTRVASKRKLKKRFDLSGLFDYMDNKFEKEHNTRNYNLLKEFRKKYPHQKFRIGYLGFVQRLMGRRWYAVCIHNRQRSVCAHDLCQGISVCKHKIRRSDCKDPDCKGGGANCSHGFRKGQCKTCGHLRCHHGLLHYRCRNDECSGTSLCVHKRIRNLCSDPECGGGTSLCVHSLPRSKCHDTNCGAGTYCKHDIARSLCLDSDCNGGGSFCMHMIIRRCCPDPVCEGGTGLCVKCCIERKVKDGYCTKCHPDHIPNMAGASKIACEFMCSLQAYLGSRVNIQHIHYNKITKSVTGSEYKLPEYKQKKVDGFYIGLNGERIVIEFLGDHYHGHPALWGPDEQNTNRYGELHKDNFYDTERIFNKVLSFGYVIRYVWERDYYKFKALQSLQSPMSILKKFKGKLEY